MQAGPRVPKEGVSVTHGPGHGPLWSDPIGSLEVPVIYLGSIDIRRQKYKVST